MYIEENKHFKDLIYLPVVVGSCCVVDAVCEVKIVRLFLREFSHFDLTEDSVAVVKFETSSNRKWRRSRKEV